MFIRVDGIFPSYASNPITTAVGTGPQWNYNLFYLSDIIAYSRGYPIPEPTTSLPERAPMKYYNEIKDKGELIQFTITFNCNIDMDYK